jgi:hypothetical protein
LKISFSGRYAQNAETFGINFQALVDGKTYVCIVSQEALQDVDAAQALGSAEDQFLANRSRFEAIAERKIRAGATSPVHINSADVLARK